MHEIHFPTEGVFATLSRDNPRPPLDVSFANGLSLAVHLNVLLFHRNAALSNFPQPARASTFPKEMTLVAVEWIRNAWNTVCFLSAFFAENEEQSCFDVWKLRKKYWCNGIWNRSKKRLTLLLGYRTKKFIQFPFVNVFRWRMRCHSYVTILGIEIEK